MPKEPKSESSLAVVGIDPGLKGGVALIHDRHIITYPMPIDEHGVNVRYLLELLPPQGVAFIEEPFLITHQGAKSAMTMGINFGRILSVLECLDYSYERVHPNSWQHAVGIVRNGNTKEQSINICKMLYPNVSLIPERCKVPQDGLADALLIAHYGKSRLCLSSPYASVSCH